MKLLGVEAGRGVAALLVVTFHATRMLAGAKYYGEMPAGGRSDSATPGSISSSS